MRERETNEGKNDGKTGAGRRGFLRFAGLSGIVGGAVALVAGGRAAKAETAAEAPTGRGYRETDHVRQAYDTARF